MRKTLWKTGLAAALLFAALPSTALACEKCFGVGSDTALSEGISLAMLALIVMMGVIWTGFGAFFVHMRKRARLLEPGDLLVDEFGHILERPPNAPSTT